MRLIDADEIKSPNVVIFEMPLFGKMEPVVRLKEIQKYMPTVDAQPVVHGKWEDNHTTCSVCGWQMIDDVTESRMMLGFKFCPNCGAKMDGGT